MSKAIELKVSFTVSEDDLDNRLKINPERYARFVRDSIKVFLTSRTFIPHDNVEVTIEY